MRTTLAHHDHWTTTWRKTDAVLTLARAGAAQHPKAKLRDSLSLYPHAASPGSKRRIGLKGLFKSATRSLMKWVARLPAWHWLTRLRAHRSYTRADFAPAGI